MSLWELLFPEKCILCEDVLARGVRGVCSSCRGKLPYITEPRCKHCGKPVSSVRQEYCSGCDARISRSCLDGGLVLWEYTDAMKRVMADFKYGGCEGRADFFAEELAVNYGGRFKAWGIQAIVPVPLHRRKMWFRGYNQAESLALALGEKLRIPVESGCLKRTRYTKPQKGLDSRQRRNNLRHAFSAGKEADRKMKDCPAVLLVDDIYTTGATLEACARVLRRFGIKKVYFACLCTGRDH